MRLAAKDKRVVVEALPWYQRAHGLRWVSLRYFNAAGASERCSEDHDPETHLIPLVLRCAAGRSAHVELLGDDYPTPDGTCVRDYVHVVDLARAHAHALAGLDRSAAAIYNLGCGGAGHSVRAVVELARRVTGAAIPVRVAPRRTGDPPVLVARTEKIRRELGWRPQADLEVIVSSAWRWLQRHPQGYAG